MNKTKAYSALNLSVIFNLSLNHQDICLQAANKDGD